MGIPYELFWKLNPKKMKPFYKVQKMQEKKQDNDMWRLGMYIFSACDSAVQRGMGNKQARYIEKPFLEDMELEEISQEEKEKKEIQKAILAEEQWIAQQCVKNLPKTIIK